MGRRVVLPSRTDLRCRPEAKSPAGPAWGYGQAVRASQEAARSQPAREVPKGRRRVAEGEALRPSPRSGPPKTRRAPAGRLGIRASPQPKTQDTPCGAWRKAVANPGLGPWGRALGTGDRGTVALAGRLGIRASPQPKTRDAPCGAWRKAAANPGLRPWGLALGLPRHRFAVQRRRLRIRARIPIGSAEQKGPPGAHPKVRSCVVASGRAYSPEGTPEGSRG